MTATTTEPKKKPRKSPRRSRELPPPLTEGARLLRVWVARQRLTQREAAETIASWLSGATHQATVWRWLHGHSIPSPEALPILAERCRVPIAEWYAKPKA